MNRWNRLATIALSAPLLLIGSLPALEQGSLAQSSAPSWLDRRPVPQNWNRPGSSIPRAQSVGEGDLGIDERCRRQVRSPFTPLDQHITRAGWSLYGPVQTYNRTVVISAMTGTDGMCRPMGYQQFVFVGDRFAGTLSPVAMGARADGSSNRIDLQSESDISADFNRYTNADALCCPSRTSTVTYRIDTTPRGPIVVPREVFTQSNRAASP